jgi:hypothetical protein
MAAMRMKERSGPGMTAVSTAGKGGEAFARVLFCWSDGGAPLAGLPEYAEELTDRQKEADTKRIKVRRGQFIIGYLS